MPYTSYVEILIFCFYKKKEKNTGNAKKVSQSFTNNQYTVFVKKNFSLFVWPLPSHCGGGEGVGEGEG